MLFDAVRKCGNASVREEVAREVGGAKGSREE